MTDRLTRGGAPVAQRRLIEAAQRGDHRAEHELVRLYEPLTRRAAWRLRLPPWCERDDLVQEARLGLVAAIRAWRPERGPFPAFADRCVSNQALLALKAACRHNDRPLNHAVSLDSAAERFATHDDEPWPLTLLGTLSPAADARTDPEACVLAREQLASVLRAMSTLTARERTALTGAINGRSYERLAPSVGGTPKAASALAYRARRKLAAALPRAG